MKLLYWAAIYYKDWAKDLFSLGHTNMGSKFVFYWPIILPPMLEQLGLLDMGVCSIITTGDKLQPSTSTLSVRFFHFGSFTSTVGIIWKDDFGSSTLLSIPPFNFGCHRLQLFHLPPFRFFHFDLYN